MSDSEFFLASSTRAILKLEDAVHLLKQKGRVEQAVAANDPALTLDTAKSFLESVLKTILADRIKKPDLFQDMNPLYKSVRDELPLNRDEVAAKILEKLTNSIVHNIAELRNKYGAASHGDDGFYDNPIEMPEAEMVAYLVDGMSGFLFQKHKMHGDPELAARIYYLDYPKFNDYLDNQYEGYKLPLDGDRYLDLLPSKILFLSDVDNYAYREMLLQYLSTEKEDLEAIEGIIEEEAVKEVVQIMHSEEVMEIPEVESTPHEKGVQQIMQVMLVNDEVRMSVNDDELRQVAEFAVDFTKNQAGIDWQSRESLRARFRTFLRRKLIKIMFPEAFMDHAMDHAIEKAAELYPSRMSGS